MMVDQLLLAIDGGGTKTEVCVARVVDGGSPVIVGRAVGGPTNLTSNGAEQVIAELTSAIFAASQDAQLASPKFDRAIIALAGAADENACREIDEWVTHEEIAKRVEVVSDAELILAIAESLAPEGCASIALLAGTGSVAFGRQPDTLEMVRAGGWGPLIGDDGSGFWLGRAGLRHVLQCADDGEPLGELGEMIYKAIGSDTPRGLITRVHESNEPLPAIANLATVVFQAAEQGDLAAQDILTEAAVYLGLLVGQVKRNLPQESERTVVACCGSLITTKTVLTNRIEELIRASGIKELYFIEDPATAAIQLAASLILRD